MLFVAPCHDFIAATMVSDYIPRRYIYIYEERIGVSRNRGHQDFSSVETVSIPV